MVAEAARHTALLKQRNLPLGMKYHWSVLSKAILKRFNTTKFISQDEALLAECRIEDLP
jgi:hypothetical protein